MGSSKVESDKLGMTRDMLADVAKKDCQLLFPQDLVVADRFAEDAETKIVSANQVPPGWMALDIGRLP